MMSIQVSVSSMIITIMIAVCPVSAQSPVGTAITYQGHLKDDGRPANGNYDFQFALYDDPDFGSQVNGVLEITDQQVVNGLFAVTLDFGDVFDGTALWLYIRVRPGDSTGAYTSLLPRQPLTATPYAIYALNSTGDGQSNTLDQAYDQGGPGAGRRIIADAGDVEIVGANGLIVDNEIYSTSGGFRFPDDTIQLTAANSISEHGLLSGLLDNDHPQYMLNGEPNSVTTSMIQNHSVTAEKISSDSPVNGQVLKWDGSNIIWDDEAGSSLWQSSGSSVYYSSGNVGIGVSNPTEALVVQGQVEFVGPTNGPVLRIMREGGGNNHGGLRLRTDDALHIYGEDWIYLDAGNGGEIHCVNPSNGTWHIVKAANFLYSSTKEIKRDIRVLDEEERSRSLEYVRKLRPVTYRFRWEEESSPVMQIPHRGFIAEELPRELVDKTGEAVDMYALVTTITVAIQELDKNVAFIKSMEREPQFAELTARLEYLEELVAELTKSTNGGVR